MSLRNKFEEVKKCVKSVKVRLFITLSLTILIIIIFLIGVNSFALEKFYLYSKENTLEDVYYQLNEYYNGNNHELDLEREMERIAIKNNFEILIKDNDNMTIYSSNADFYYVIDAIMGTSSSQTKDTLESNNNFIIRLQKDFKNNLNYIMLSGVLDNGYHVFIRVPVTSIQDSVTISNNFLILMAGFTILVSAVVVSFISKKFTEPILELNKIAKKMSNLDFSHKYQVTNVDDEINNLGKSINIMSDKLESTIKQLRNTNIELEKDIEEKSKIDEMRKTFISDVSHELKTPIALIQGYSEGLVENVNTDDESRKFYAEVILDEANKMNRLVQQLLELMKLEYGKREFNNTSFDIVELEKEVIRKSQVMLDEKDVKVEITGEETLKVYADDFYIEQIITNYLTNAIKNVKEKNNQKIIKIENSINEKNGKSRIEIFNTGDNISEEDISRIWNRFYKVDKSRNRQAGGSGIGLAFVKAIMTNYNNDYGVINCEDGVIFYIELDNTEKNRPDLVN